MFALNHSDTEKSGEESTVSSETDSSPESTSSSKIQDLTVTIYEDCEDGNIDGWIVEDNNPGNAVISNIQDDVRASRVINFKGDGINNGYMFGKPDGSPLGLKSNFVIEWNMKYGEDYIIYVDLDTTAGRRIVEYKPLNNFEYENNLIIKYSLGEETKGGDWQKIVRDLSYDVADGQDGVEVLEIKYFYVRGSGRIDDLKFTNKIPDGVDTDNDKIDDSDEIYTYGTSPYLADSDEDKISDKQELSFWGDRWNEDKDNDGLVNLIDDDSDNDGILDGDEIENGTDPAEK